MKYHSRDLASILQHCCVSNLLSIAKGHANQHFNNYEILITDHFIICKIRQVKMSPKLLECDGKVSFENTFRKTGKLFSFIVHE